MDMSVSLGVGLVLIVVSALLGRTLVKLKVANINTGVASRRLDAIEGSLNWERELRRKSDKKRIDKSLEVRDVLIKNTLLHREIKSLKSQLAYQVTQNIVSGKIIDVKPMEEKHED